MIDLLSYIVREVKSGRLKKAAAAALLSQMRSQNSVGPIGTFLTVKLDGVLHPLLQSNTSDLSEQRFSSTFIGNEFFLSDHVVRGSKVLPGVCYLEMARAAVAASALEAGEDERVSIVLKNVVWAQPVVVDECTEIHLGVYPDEQGELAYEIYSETGEKVENEGEPERVIHSQGYARIEAKYEAERLDLPVLQQGCDQRMEVNECYAAFIELGLKYGPAHRGLTSIQRGVDSKGGRYVLAQVQLPECVSETQGAYGLHPSVLDSALQASAGLALQSEGSGTSEGGTKPRLPFALESLEIFERSPARGYVYVRLSGEEGERAEKLQKLDIDVCDEQGKVCVRLKGFTLRVLESDVAIGAVRAKTAVTEDSVAAGAMHFVPRWDVVTVSLGERWPSTESKGVVIGGSVEQQHALHARYPAFHILTLDAQDSIDRIAEQLQAHGEIEHILWLTPPSQVMEPMAVTDERVISEQAVGVVSGFRLIKALLQLGYGSRVLGLSIVTWQTQAINERERIDPTHASIHGFIGSLTKEYAQWNIRLVDLPIEGEWPLEEVLRLPADAQGDAWAYRTGEWYRQQLVPCTVQAPTTSSFRQGGVYVVIGGAGGIGEVFSEYLIRKYQAQVIWIGRRACDADIQAKLNRLAMLGPMPTYLCADARDRKAMEHAYQEIKNRHPQIHGLVHSAIALLDKSLANMEEERFIAGLSAKVDISVRLAQVFASESLDCVLFFSAMQSFLKAAGQSNYAAGCTFKDAYANALSKALGCSIKVMNWGYWGSVGVVATEEHRARMAQRGVGSIEPEDGMHAIEVLLGNSFRQLGYVKPAPASTRALTSSSSSAPPASVVDLPGSPSPASLLTLREQATAALKRLVGQVLQIPVQQLDASEPLEKYGVDSILVVKMTGAINTVFSHVASTVFFEYRTLAALVDHLITTQPEAALRWVGLEARVGVRALQGEGTERSEGAVAKLPQGRRARRYGLRSMRRMAEGVSEPWATPVPQAIAIIGLSGRYPQANTVHEFWEHLKAGKACISEIPADRWDWRAYYSEEKGKLGSMYSKWGGFMEEIAGFDPLFFHLSPREAERMDPQERLFLQEAYASIEDAGYTPKNLSTDKQVGVYVGVMNSTYHRSPSYWSVANRVSYLLDFQGPSLAVDTACSSSLTAIHLAVESLRSGHCQCALAGGVNLIIDPIQYLGLSAMTMLSSGPECKSFGDQADGFVDGEGVGVIVLKRLSQAIADHDHIYGVIKGSALNAGGKTHGYTVPNLSAQAQVIGHALKDAQVDARTISYIEAHGTGTSLGDPIEIAGLKKAFSHYTEERQFCALGSAKSNIGHLESAAGIAGLTKVLLQMKHRTLVPSLHSEVLNPQIDFASTPFRVQQSLTAWPRPRIAINHEDEKEYPRIAGISSFGAGGANAHVIVEEYCVPQSIFDPSIGISADHPALIVLSAKTEERLQIQVQQLLAHLTDHSYAESELVSIAYTLQVGREAMEQRIAFTATSLEQLKAKLQGYLEGQLERGEIEACYRGEVKKNKEALAVFTVDEELQEALGKWLQRGKYTKLLELWVKGLMFDWLQLYPSTQPQRVSLPTYPFAKDRYWVEDSDERMVAHAPGGGSPEGGYSDDAEDSTWEAPPGAMSADEDLSGSVWLAPRWDVVRLEAGMPWPLKDARVVLAGGSVDEQQAIRVQYAQGEVLELSGAESVEALAQRLQSFGSIDHVVWITPRSVMDEGVDEGTESFEESLQAQAAGVLSGFRLIKALLHLGYGSRALGLSVVTWQTQGVSALDAIQAGQASVHGLIGSLAKECVNWQIRLIDLPLATPWPLNELLRLPADREGNAWAYRSGDWYRQQVVPCSVQAPTAPSFRQGGVYVVIGGAGGIGEVFSEYLIQHYDAQVIWIGRRTLDASIQAKLDRLSHFGPTPLYVSADAGDRAALEGAYQEIKQRYPRVHGVVHSAIALLDKSLANMDEARFTAGLSAKVAVSVRLAQVFGAEPLDFVLFFSSLQSFTKAAGQSNYAAGCTFIDAFAHRLSQQWSYPVKVMHWGYWGSVGVVASEDYRTRMAHAGMGSIEPEEGMRALETLLGSSFNQLGYVKTTQPQALAGITGIASEAPLIELPRSLPALTLKNAEEHASEASLVELRAVVADTSFNEFEAVLSKLLAVQLHSLKLWDLAAGADAEDGTQRVQLPGVYERWLTESVRILTEHGYLQQIQASDGALRVVASAALDPSSVWSEWETQKPGWLDVSSLRAQVSLVEATLRVLPEILTEKIPATDILFPHSSMERVEGIYKGNPVSDYFNEVVAQRLVGYLNARLEQDPTTRLRILEIGAGTGGTSAAVFAALKPYQDHMAEYCYTDVSKAFLLHAQAQYGEQTPYLKYQLFNVERPLAEQGLAVGEYDVVIAANVLHATRHIRQTVRNTQALLKRGGVLLLNEISQSNVFAHLTFGLLKGWWLYDDAAVRIPGTPGLSPTSWHRVLTEEGFESIGFPAEGAHDLGQQIVMAQSNGVIRQPRASTTMLTSPSSRSPASSRVTPKGSRAGGGLKPVARREAMQGSRVESMHESMRGSLLESHVREVLVETFATALKMEVSSLDTAESFADYGLDSIIGVQAIERLNEALGIELTTTSLFDYSTVNKLTGHIVSAYPERLARALKLTSPSHENGPAALRAARGPIAASSESRSLPREPGQPGGLGGLGGPGEQRESETPREQGEPIAIIGLSGRYAKANTVDELWSALAAGADLIEPVTRWDLSSAIAEAAAEGKSFCGHGGFLHGIDEFDSLFFNISGVEATYMDPQQRLFLEEAWKALEAAGYAGAGSEGSRCGVYVGYNGGDYQELIKEAPPAQAMWGNAASILSARIAYYLNLQGPAITIDSACSSSLVAIHLACQSLWNLETDLSIAGGVCVQCTPGFYAMANRAGMLSASGRCHTFDNRADGFVPGEGVGVVVLRRLSEAIEAGDHIEGVIRGSGINQDGATNGITAPSALSQERLERQVYERFQIHAEEIQMVEAHGTGTKLGDPIEYQALTNAFRQDTDKTHYCAIGSIKTNIGHTTAAAGVAGVIKVLLSLKHQQIPASLHYENGNTHIAFENSPFYVNTTLKDWLVDADQKRCAAVSSFGMSGTNAHLVIEEAPTLNRVHVERPGYLVVLSARSEGQLRRQVEQLIEHCERQPTVDCGNVSYTLLLGRRHFNYRLACIASNGDELKVRLKKWLEKDKAAHVYMAALQDKDRREQPSLKRYGNQCIEECSELHDPSAYLEHLSMIADLYIQGYPLNFERLFAGDEYSRLSLPTYPFAKERYWVEESKAVGKVIQSLALHPLLQTNTSDISGLRFSSTFTGNEFFLSDHVVRGSKVLPGVCYLEMARVALCEALIDESEVASQSLMQKDVVWLRPFVVGDAPRLIHINVYENEQGEYEYEIASRAADTKTATEATEVDESVLLHCQGRVVINARHAAPRLDLERLQAQCSTEEISIAQCYAAFSALGLKYGPAHRGLTSIQRGVDSKGGRYVLAQVQLPECVSETQGAYGLHPSVLDSALQASVGLALQSEGSGTSEGGTKPRLPFALESLEMFERSPARGYVYVRLSGEEGERAEKLQKLDIDVCDEQGKVCVRLKGFTSRVLEGDLPIGAVRTTTAVTEDSVVAGAVHLVPRWDVVTVSLGERWPSTESKGVVIGGSVEQQHALHARYPAFHILTLDAQDSIDRIAEQLQAQGEIEHILWLTPPSQVMEPMAVTDERVISEQAVGVVSGFRLIKALLQLGYGSRALGLSIVTWQTQAINERERIDPTHASIHGFIGSLAKEYAQWNIRLVDLPIEGEWPLEEVLRLPADAQGDAWAYRTGEWYRQQLVPCTVQAPTTSSFRQGGVYVVIGGAGGIGEVFSEYLIRKYQAQVIWIGRRACDADIQAKLNRLAMLGPMPTYLCADARDRKAMEHAYQEIKNRHPQIHGLVHSAIALLDKSLANMEEERFIAGLSAKVDISVRLAQVFASESLECVLFFSAMQSFLKAAGQSNYAAGCTFKDAYANALSKAWGCSIKVMNWGYWGSVGVVATEEHRARMAQRGVGSIEPEDGMHAIEALLESPFNQLGYVKTVNPTAMEDRASQECIVALPVMLPVMNKAELLRRTALVSTAGMRVRVQHSAYSQFEDLLVTLLGVQLRTLRVFPEGGGWAQNNAAIETWKQIQLPESYGRWLTQSVRVLTEHGYLGQDNGVMVSALAALTSEEVWSQWGAQTPRWREDPSLRAQVNLVEATLRALPEILMGKKPPTEVMFPNSSMALVEGIYKDQPIADYFNAVLVEALVGYIEDRLRAEPSARIRLLEIGAGTGGTSARVFTALRPYVAQIEEYCYTDVSKAFLLHAEQTYGASAPYLNYRLFNVEHSLASQGIAIGRYDVVIATNVLHATRQIRQTVRNAKAALKGHGLLLLNEISQPSVFAHLTFGLLEGWWLYEDPVLRIPGTPALTPAQWQRVLQEEGFEGVLFPAEAAQIYGQQVIIAQSDGVVRQPHFLKPAPASTRALTSSPSSAPPASVVDLPGSPSPASLLTLREQATAALKRLVGQVLQIPVQQLDASEPLEKYGVDSILVVKMTGAINTVFSHVASTVFFEYRTLAALVDHLITTQPEAALRWVGLEARVGVRALQGEGTERSEGAVAKLPQGRRARRYGLRSMRRVAEGVSEPWVTPVPQAIAIIGLSGRYPQANTVHEFWEHLKAGKACISEIPADRWDWRAYYSEEKGKLGSMYSKWGGFMEEIAGFDPLFFHLSPREAERMDPQERLFLQEAYASIEDAGYTPKNLSTDKQVGVYVGVMNSTYHRSPSYWSVANRVSYLLDFQGPSLAVDTACSSSLTAIHLAVESLRSGHCQCALAGGVNLIVDPIQYLGLSAMTMLSSGPECKSFGDQADGFVDGEGVGVIVLKRLSQAIADHDHIYGVIKGSALNAGGKTHGYTVPNLSAQAQVIGHALKDAQVDARTISYIEAHGTGTSLGDPIEIAGLKKAFSHYTEERQFCALGSAKSNIGHLESAAGIAGLTKVLLQMKHRTLVPSLHSEVLNPQIDFANTPFRVQQSLTAWPRPRIAIHHADEKEYPRIAGISSFGAGGANAHVIVEEYCAEPFAHSPHIEVTPGHPALIVLSAKTEERLQIQVQQLLAHLTDHSYAEGELVSIAYTLQVGREAMEQRIAFTATSLEQLKAKLQGYLEGQLERGEIEACYRGEVKKNKEALAVFTVDEELQEALGKWLQRGKYTKLLELWVKGLMFDWLQLYPSTYPQRVSLPTYPFAKDRYWITEELSVPGEISPAVNRTEGSVKHPFNSEDIDALFESLITDQIPQSTVIEKIRLALTV